MIADPVWMFRNLPMVLSVAAMIIAAKGIILLIVLLLFGKSRGVALSTGLCLCQDVLQQLREWYTAPFIILSARDQESQKIKALDHGAGDYVTKPFGIGELIARMRTALRHSRRITPEETTPVCFGYRFTAEC